MAHRYSATTNGGSRSSQQQVQTQFSHQATAQRRSYGGAWNGASALSGSVFGSATANSSGSYNHHHHHRASNRESTSLLRPGLTGGNQQTLTGSSSSAIAAAEELDELDEFKLQLSAYRFIYVVQGAFMGMLGPALAFFSALAWQESHLDAPVYGFGPIFAAHGGAALVMSFMSELMLRVAIEMNLVKQLTVALLVGSAAWYACLTPVAAATGNLGVGIYFIAKGIWTALLNISLNRCCLWIAGEKIERGRSLVTSMNLYYGLGTVIGAVTAVVLTKLGLDLSWAFFALAISTAIPIALIVTLPCPRSYYGRDEHQTLLAFEDPTRRVPTVPSPIIGGVFLHVKHIGHSANCNPDTYDAKNNFIILLVTIFATVLFGIQLGLAAFFYDYIGHVLSVEASGFVQSSRATAAGDQAFWQCVLMALFYAALTSSYAFFSKFMFHALNLYSIFLLSIVCLVSSFGILFGAEMGFVAFTICSILFGFALAPLFTLSIHCLTRVINELLIRRVSSLIVFGCGMGEIFIPVLMGFFMSGQSGQTNGSVAVSAITFLLSITLVGVSGLLLWNVKSRVEELALTNTAPVDPYAAISADARLVHTPPQRQRRARKGPRY